MTDTPAPPAPDEEKAPTKRARRTTPKRGYGSQYRCSFCGKQQDEVQRLIAGPGGVYICNECVGLCNEILAEAEPEQSAETKFVTNENTVPTTNTMLLDISARQIMQHSVFVNAALYGRGARWHFTFRPDGDVEMAVQVDSSVMAEVIEALGKETDDEDAQG